MKMCRSNSFVLPLVAVLFVGLLAFGIYRKTSRAVAPPLYDALSYYEKAYYVWQGLTSEKGFVPPFEAAPGIRPPGSVPVTAPFGVRVAREGYQWFYFRNILAPILIWMAACFLAFPVTARDPGDQKLRLALVASLGMLPLFFNMEYNEEIIMGYWGLQDTLVASVAALALALVLLGQDRRSAPQTALGLALAGYTIWIKPSGILVTLVVSAFWIGEFAFRLWSFRHDREQKSLTGRYALRTFPFLLVFPLFFAGIAFTSPYLSNANIEWAKEAQSIVLDMYSTVSFAPLKILANRSVGYIWLTVFLLVGLAALFLSILKRKAFVSTATARIFLSAGALLCSFYWWYKMAGPLDRYMFPFVLMCVIGVGNPLWVLMTASIKQAHKNLLALFFGALALFPLIVLLHGAPSKDLQVFLGINLSSGGYKNAVAAGKFLKSEAKTREGIVAVFAPDPAGAAMGTAFVESFLELANLTGSHFKILHPFPWAKGATISGEQLCCADFILVNEAEEISLAPLGGRAADIWQEMLVLKQFLKDLTGDDGVKRTAFSGLSVIEVVDRNKLKRAFFRMADSFNWRREFYDENNRWRDLEAGFDTARDVAYHASASSPDGALAPTSRVKMLSGGLPGDFVVEPDTPPSILVPPFSNNNKQKAYLRMELSVPSPKTQQIFYRDGTAAGSNEGVAGAECGRGDNILFYEVPLTGESTSLRIGTGGEASRQSLKSIEIRRAD